MFFLHLNHLIMQLLCYLLCRIDLVYGIPINYGQSFHEQLVLLPGYLYGFVSCPGPAERSHIESLVQKQEPVTFPKQAFDPVRTRSAKKKEYVLLVRIEMVLALDGCCQTFYAAPQISIADRYDNLGKHRGVI